MNDYGSLSKECVDEDDLLDSELMTEGPFLYINPKVEAWPRSTRWDAMRHADCKNRAA